MVNIGKELLAARTDAGAAINFLAKVVTEIYWIVFVLLPIYEYFWYWDDIIWSAGVHPKVYRSYSTHFTFV